MLCNVAEILFSHASCTGQISLYTGSKAQRPSYAIFPGPAFMSRAKRASQATKIVAAGLHRRFVASIDRLRKSRMKTAHTHTSLAKPHHDTWEPHKAPQLDSACVTPSNWMSCKSYLCQGFSFSRSCNTSQADSCSIACMQD